MDDVFSAYGLDDYDVPMEEDLVAGLDETLFNQSKQADLFIFQMLIEYQLLKQKEILLNLIATIPKKAPPKLKKSDPLVRCLARTFNGQQCSRKSRDPTTDLCGNHLQALPYGRITEDIPDSHQMIDKKTRGRKSKTSGEEIPLSEIDLDQYVKTEPITIEGKDYLIDERGVVFTSDSSNNIVALRVDSNQYQWFVDDS